MKENEYYLNPFKCKNCDSIIKFRPNRRYRIPVIFCTPQCKNAWYRKIKEEIYYQNPFTCQSCKCIIPYSKIKRFKSGIAKYCGNSCSVKETNKYRFTDEVKKKIGDKQKEIQKRVWTKKKRNTHSNLMKKAVNKHPKSYSTENICGRVKSIKTIDSYGNETKCNGKWELLVSEYLNSHNIKWTNIIQENFQYTFKGKLHRYFPDFYLPDNDCYLEIKGYERERDIAKWSQFPKKLIILKRIEIDKIKDGSFIIDF